MEKTLVILRNSGCSTYAVHLEMGNPPQKLVSGLSLDLSRLRTELSQHSCSEEEITKAMRDLEVSDSATIYGCP